MTKRDQTRKRTGGKESGGKYYFEVILCRKLKKIYIPYIYRERSFCIHSNIYIPVGSYLDWSETIFSSLYQSLLIAGEVAYDYPILPPLHGIKIVAHILGKISAKPILYCMRRHGWGWGIGNLEPWLPFVTVHLWPPGRDNSGVIFFYLSENYR